MAASLLGKGEARNPWKAGKTQILNDWPRKKGPGSDAAWVATERVEVLET
jgi:hypothetical protein